MQTHVNSSDLLEYKKSSFCVPSQINATEGPIYACVISLVRHACSYYLRY